MKLLAVVADGFTDLRAHLGRTVLQTMGVVLGVGSVVATMGLSAGGKEKSMQYYAESGGALKVIVFPKPLESLQVTARQRASLGLTLDDIKAIKATIPGFDLVEPEVEKRLACRTPQLTRSRDVTGTGATYAVLNELILERGRFITADDIASSSAVCVLGTERAEEFFGTDDPLGRSIALGSGNYTVVGLLKYREFYWSKAETYNALGWMNRVILVPVTSMLAREVGSGSQQIEDVVLRLASAEAHKEAIPALRRLLLTRHGAEDFQVYDRQERLQQMDQEGKVYDVAFRVCGLISLLVGGIVVANILLASFRERMREVGVRKALGAKGWHIATQFLVESVVVSGFGGVVGLFAGVGFVHWLASLIEQPAALTPVMIVAAVACSTIVGLVFGFIPAVMASRLDPVVALRYE